MTTPPWPADRRTLRRAAAAVSCGMTALLIGCTGTRTVPVPAGAPMAEDVRGASADCLADDVLRAFGVETAVRQGVDLLPSAATPGTHDVPSGFEPAYVIECRLDAAVPLRPGETATVDPQTNAISTTPESPMNGISAEFDRLVVRVAAVRLVGDLAPIIAELDRDDETAGVDDGCPLIFIAKPQTYLVDAHGGAVRVEWPTDGCGFVLASGLEALTDLDEVDTEMMVRSLG